MRIAVTKPLFAWDCLDDGPELKTIREFFAITPDTQLLNYLQTRRGRGRDDYPITVLWGVCLLQPLLRHVHVESVLDELRRNPSLRRILGIDSAEQVPKKYNMSRFLKVLGSADVLPLLREVFDTMIRRLGTAVKDLGVHTAGDATKLSARRQRAAGDAGGLPQPTGGRKEYADEAGKVVKVVEWFGYKLHLLVDVKHEVVLAYVVSSANIGDNEMIEALLDQAQANLAEEEAQDNATDGDADGAPGRIQTMAYDKAADDGKVHALLNDHGVAPVIQNRSLWKDELERMLPGHDGTSNVVYDEAGSLHCYDKVSDPPVRHAMAYIGHEPKRGTVKYRCPACHQGWSCPSHDRCNAGKRYGKTVRVKCEIDLRRFPPIPRATKTFERLYKGRTAVERVNGRFKIFWGADDGNVTGAERFHAHVAAVMVVHAGLATLLAASPRRDGTLGQTRLSPIAQALRRSAGL